MIIVNAGLLEIDVVIIPEYRRIAVRRLELCENRTGVIYLNYYITAIFVSLGSMCCDFARKHAIYAIKRIRPSDNEWTKCVVDGVRKLSE